MDQSDFQNMASGNSVLCAVKHKEAVVIDPWTTPILFSGNEPPGYHDNSGSYGRRMAVVAFNYGVDKPDGSLSERLKQELPAFIAKCNRAYRNMVRRYGNQGVWNILPVEFKNQRAELTATSNALIGFLTSAFVRKGERLYMPLDVLRAAVMAHAQRNNLVRPQWGGDYYRGPLTAENLKIGVAVQRKYYPRHTKTRVDDIYVFGIDIAANCVDGSVPGNAADAFMQPAAAGIMPAQGAAVRGRPPQMGMRQAILMAPPPPPAVPPPARGAQPALNPRKRPRTDPDPVMDDDAPMQ